MLAINNLTLKSMYYLYKHVIDMHLDIIFPVMVRECGQTLARVRVSWT